VVVPVELVRQDIAIVVVGVAGSVQGRCSRLVPDVKKNLRSGM